MSNIIDRSDRSDMTEISDGRTDGRNLTDGQTNRHDRQDMDMTEYGVRYTEYGTCNACNRRWNIIVPQGTTGLLVGEKYLTSAQLY